MGKDEYLIGEIAEALGISVDTVRYYNKMGIVTPLRKEDNHYRYFDLNAVSNLHSVTLLRSLGVPIEKLQGCLVQRDLGMLIADVRERQQNIQCEIDLLLHQQEEIARLRAVLEQVGANYNETVIRESPQWGVLYEKPELDIARLVRAFNSAMTEKECFPTYAFILPKESFLAHNRNYSHYGLLVTGPCLEFSACERTIEPQKCAYYIHFGKQKDLQTAYDAIYVWIQEHGCHVSGDIVERFIISGPTDSLMELWVPIES